MTTLREAAAQALEALEGKRYTACGWRSDCDKAITALRAALAEPVQEPVAWGVFDGPNLHDVNFTEEEAHEMVRLKGDGSVVKPLYTAPPQRPAEPVQEPPEFPPHDDKVHAGAVYWYVGTDGKYYSSNEVKLFMETKNKSLHYEPPKWVLDNFDLIPLYTSPPQRKPLTEEEISNIWDGHVVPVFGKNGINPIVFARAIERAHGIGEQP